MLRIFKNGQKLTEDIPIDLEPQLAAVSAYVTSLEQRVATLESKVSSLETRATNAENRLAFYDARLRFNDAQGWPMEWVSQGNYTNGYVIHVNTSGTIQIVKYTNGSASIIRNI